MDELKKILQEYVATANNPEYNSDWNIINSKFPELADYDPKLLQEYVATANNPEYGSDWDLINNKFPEFSSSKGVTAEGNGELGSPSADTISSSESEKTDNQFQLPTPEFFNNIKSQMGKYKTVRDASGKVMGYDPEKQTPIYDPKSGRYNVENNPSAKVNKIVIDKLKESAGIPDEVLNALEKTKGIAEIEPLKKVFDFLNESRDGFKDKTAQEVLNELNIDYKEGGDYIKEEAEKAMKEIPYFQYENKDLRKQLIDRDYFGGTDSRMPTDSGTVKDLFGDISQYGFNVEDFNGYLESSNPFVKRMMEEGFADEKLDAQKVEYQMFKSMSNYVGDRVKYLNQYEKILNYRQGNGEDVSEELKNVQYEKQNLPKNLLNYTQENLPEFINLIEQRRNKTVKDYQAYKNKETGVLGEFTEKVSQGAFNALSDAIITVADGLDFDNFAEEARLGKEISDMFESNPMLDLFGEGKKVKYKNNEYLITDDNQIIDLETKKNVTSIAPELGLDINKLKELEGENDFFFSPYNATVASGDVLGNLAVQVLATRGLGGVVGNSTKAMIASNMAVTGGVIYTSTYEDTLKQLRDQGFSDAESIQYANDIALTTGFVGMVTSSFAYNPEALKLLGGGKGTFIKSLIKDALKAELEGGKKAMIQSIKDGTVRFLASGGKEGIEEAIQENLEYIGQQLATQEVNKQVGEDVLNGEITVKDILNNTILAFGSSAALAGAGNLSESTPDKIQLYSTLASDLVTTTENINKMVDDGIIEQAQGEKLVKDVENFMKYANKVPKDLHEENLFPMIDLLDKRNNLETRKKVEDKAFHKGINEEIENVDNKIAQLMGKAPVTDFKSVQGKQLVDLKEKAVKELRAEDNTKKYTAEEISTRAEQIFNEETGLTTKRDNKWQEKAKKQLPESSYETNQQIEEDLNNGTWGVVTAENPNNKVVTDKQNESANKKARKWLEEKGYTVEETVGQYDNKGEKGFFVKNLSKEDAVEFAKEFNQEAVATNEGLVDKEGNVTPMNNLSIGENVSNGNHTSIKTKEGVVNFRLESNQDTSEQATLENTNPDAYITKTKGGSYYDNVSNRVIEKNGNKWEIKNEVTGEVESEHKTLKEAKDKAHKDNIESGKLSKTNEQNTQGQSNTSTSQETGETNQQEGTGGSGTKDVQGTVQGKTNVKTKAKKIADEMRSYKINASLKDSMSKLSVSSGFEVAWDLAIETAATTVELTGNVAQGIISAVDSLRNSSWYHNLSREGKIKAERMLKEDLIRQFNNDEDMERSYYDSIKASWGKIKEVTIQKMVDRFYKLRKELSNNFIIYGDSVDFSQAEKLMHGKAANDLDNFYKNEMEPLMEKISKKGYTFEQVSDYLYAKHAEERNKYIKENVDPENEFGSGMTPQTINKILNETYTSEQIAELEEFAKDVYKIVQGTRDTMLKHGLITQEQFDAYSDYYKNYVPLRGFESETIEGAINISGVDVNVRGKEKRSSGRSTKADNIIANVIAQRSIAHLEGRKNEVLQKLHKLGTENPSNDIFNVYHEKELPKHLVVKSDGTKARVPENPYTRTDYVGVKVEGEQYYIKFANAELGRILNGSNVEKANIITKTLRVLNRYLSATLTTLDPEFVISNFTRDIQTAMVNIMAEADINDALQGQNIAPQVAADTGKAIRAIYGNERKGKVDTEFRQYYEEFKEDGAKTGWANQYQLTDIKKKLANLQKAHEAKPISFTNIKNRVKAGLEFINDVNTSVENGVRLSAYINGRRAGMTREQAAEMAKELTVNFNKSGEWGSALNSVYLFFNASVQGNVRFIKAMTTRKKSLRPDGSIKKSLNRGQKIAGGLTVFAAGLTMLNQAISDDDDDGQSFYSKISDFEKERNLIVMNPLNGRDYFKIPLPYGYNIFHNTGTILAEVSSGERSVGDGIGFLTSATIGAFSPISLGNSKDTVKTILNISTPTILKPVADLAKNEDFFGQQIYNEDLPFGLPTPDATKGRKSTPEVYKDIALFLNDLTGGNDYESGSVDVAPESIYHMFKFIIGGTGRFTTNVVETADTAIDKSQGIEKDYNLRKVPFVRKLYAEPNEYTNQTMFFDRYDLIRQRDKAIESRRTSNEMTPEDRKDRGRIKNVINVYDETAKKLKDIREEISKASAIKNPITKSRKIDKLDEKYYREIKKANKRFNDILGVNYE